MALKKIYQRMFYRWWAVNRATYTEPQADWQPSFDFTLWGEAGQEILSIYDRAGPFETRRQAEEVCARMNLAALEGRSVSVEPPPVAPGEAQIAKPFSIV